MTSFFKGTLILAVTAFFGETLEFLTNMVLTKELGEIGMGKYMAILPSVFLFVVIASLELPVSVSKYIAELQREYHRSTLQHAMRLATVTTSVLMLSAVIVFTFFPVFHGYHPMIRWLTLILIPVISFTSVARGYFMGIQQMRKIAFANFVRKFFQLLLLVVVYRFFDFDRETSILVALGTLIASEIVVFLYLMRAYVLYMRQMKNIPYKEMARKTVTKKLLGISLPTTGMRIFNSVINAIQPFLISYALMLGGVEEKTATAQFGMVAGVASTIGFFPAFIAHSLLVMLVPTVSEAYTRGEFGKLQGLLKHVIVITMLYGLAVSFILYFYGGALTKLFGTSLLAYYYLQLMIPYFLFFYLAIPMQAFLIGMNLVKDAFFHSVWSTLISNLFIFWLGSNSHLQMAGVIIGMNIEAVLLAFLHYTTIYKKLHISFSKKQSSLSEMNWGNRRA
ncbi:oligosaccharide flippase family protein [Bacillus smithii]|uniref:oligosaccharide flippase family protein n=1 Tax=Bacillus smithii TaxID=1479 RepID=UPI0022E858E6|nr:oligosaccharide flippase family protein [Bacillus smithii]